MTEIEELMSDLDRISEELDRYRFSINEANDKTAPDMLLTPLAEEPPQQAELIVPQTPDFLKKQLNAIERRLEDIQGRLNRLDELGYKLDRLDNMEEEIAAMRRLLEDKLSVDFEAMYRNLLEQMNIEAIKVYRNVQAVVLEEDAKQNHVILQVDKKAGKIKRRMNHMVILAIVSFVVSILVMLMQILPALGINLF